MWILEINRSELAKRLSELNPVYQAFSEFDYGTTEDSDVTFGLPWVTGSAYWMSATELAAYKNRVQTDDLSEAAYVIDYDNEVIYVVTRDPIGGQDSDLANNDLKGGNDPLSSERERVEGDRNPLSSLLMSNPDGFEVLGDLFNFKSNKKVAVSLLTLGSFLFLGRRRDTNS